MLTTHTSKGGVPWHILTSPTREEIKTLMTDLKIHDEYFEELSTPTPQPVCMDLSGVTYAVFHMPLRIKGQSDTFHYEEVEVDVLVDKKSITTIIYRPIEGLDLHTDSIVASPTSHPTELWWHILGQIYSNIHKEVDLLVLEIKGLREKVFTKKEHIKMISEIHRAHLAMDLPLDDHEELIDSMHETEKPDSQKDRRNSWRKLHGEYDRLVQKLRRLGAYIHELRDTQNSLISARQNNLVQTFTVLAFVFLPISFLAALFGMNVKNMPIVSHPQAFWILLGGFIGLSLLLLLFFKIRKWL